MEGRASLLCLVLGVLCPCTLVTVPNSGRLRSPVPGGGVLTVCVSDTRSDAAISSCIVTSVLLELGFRGVLRDPDKDLVFLFLVSTYLRAGKGAARKKFNTPNGLLSLSNMMLY